MIPKIIHQVWFGKCPTPLFFKTTSNLWKITNENYEHIFWDSMKLVEFIKSEFSEYQLLFSNFKYDIQRVDLLKYLILYKYGGVYIDIDYEPLKPIEPILANQNLCLGLEPKQYSDFHKTDFFIGNAFMASIPKHDFFFLLINNIVENLEQLSKHDETKYSYVMKTTGPLMLNKFYQNYKSKEQINLIASELVCPLDSNEAKEYFLGGDKIKYKEKLENAYAVHLFAGTWL
jgi:inositol phosphorylceramide mannosyltransferase catalytic subunit